MTSPVRVPPMTDRMVDEFPTGETAAALAAWFRRRWGIDPPDEPNAKGLKFNPNHDELGRFSEGPGASVSVDAFPGDTPRDAEDDDALGDVSHVDTRVVHLVDMEDHYPNHHETIVVRGEDARPSYRQPGESTTEAGDRVPANVAAFEDDVRSNDYETMALYNADGTLRATVTQHRLGGVEPPPSLLGEPGSPTNPPPALVTHNHPSGSSFSVADVTSNVYAGIPRVRAIGRLIDGRAVSYELETGAPNDILAHADAYSNEPVPTGLMTRQYRNGATSLVHFAFDYEHTVEYPATARDYARYVKAGMSDVAARTKAGEEHYHLANERAAKNLGMRYTRTIAARAPEALLAAAGVTPRGGGRRRAPGSRTTRTRP